MSAQAVILPKWLTHGGFILANNTGHSYNFLIELCPISYINPVANFGTHPLITIISWIFDGIIDFYIIDGVEGRQKSSQQPSVRLKELTYGVFHKENIEAIFRTSHIHVSRWALNCKLDDHYPNTSGNQLELLQTCNNRRWKPKL